MFYFSSIHCGYYQYLKFVISVVLILPEHSVAHREYIILCGVASTLMTIDLCLWRSYFAIDLCLWRSYFAIVYFCQFWFEDQEDFDFWIQFSVILALTQFCIFLLLKNNSYIWTGNYIAIFSISGSDKMLVFNNFNLWVILLFWEKNQFLLGATYNNSKLFRIFAGTLFLNCSTKTGLVE